MEPAMDSNAPRLGPIMQILVPVSDVDRAADWYADVLGLPLLFRFPGIAFFDAHGVRVYLARPSDADFGGRATVYFRVDDVSGTFETLERRGATVRERPAITHRDDDYDLWLAFVQDPDGNNIGLMREAPKGIARG
jgi:catechol 2,3-dioxygenase-like lactoylglutathione lyase family enzyme